MLLARSQELERRNYNFDFEIVFFRLTEEMLLLFSPVFRKVRSPANFTSWELLRPAVEVLPPAAQEHALHSTPPPHLPTAPLTSVPVSNLYFPLC